MGGRVFRPALPTSILPRKFPDNSLLPGNSRRREPPATHLIAGGRAGDRRRRAPPFLWTAGIPDGRSVAIRRARQVDQLDVGPVRARARAALGLAAVGIVPVPRLGRPAGLEGVGPRQRADQSRGAFAG